MGLAVEPPVRSDAMRWDQRQPFVRLFVRSGHAGGDRLQGGKAKAEAKSGVATAPDGQGQLRQPIVERAGVYCWSRAKTDSSDLAGLQALEVGRVQPL